MKNRIATVIIKSAELMKKATQPGVDRPPGFDPNDQNQALNPAAQGQNPPAQPALPAMPEPEFGLPGETDGERGARAWRNVRTRRQHFRAQGPAGQQLPQAQRAANVQANAAQQRAERRDRLAQRGYAGTSVRPVRRQLASVQPHALRARGLNMQQGPQPVDGADPFAQQVQHQMRVNYASPDAPILPIHDVTAPAPQFAATPGTAHSETGGLNTAMGQPSPYSNLRQLA